MAEISSVSVEMRILKALKFSGDLTALGYFSVMTLQDLGCSVMTFLHGGIEKFYSPFFPNTSN